jgi:hypothetical protein
LRWIPAADGFFRYRRWRLVVDGASDAATRRQGRASLIWAGCKPFEKNIGYLAEILFGHGSTFITGKNIFKMF